MLGKWAIENSAEYAACVRLMMVACDLVEATAASTELGQGHA
jgi:hypothetical protein